MTAQTVRRYQPETGGQAKKFKLSLLRSVPMSCHFFALAGGCLYGSLFPFESGYSDLLVTVFGYDPAKAGYLVSSIPAISLLSPLVGIWMKADLEGACKLSVVSLLAMGVGMSIIAAEQNWSPVAGSIVIGCGYTLAVVTLFSLPPVLVRATVPDEICKHVEALVLGLVYFWMSVMQFVSNTVGGKINDVMGYRQMIMWFAAQSYIGGIFMIFTLKLIVPIERSLESPADGGDGCEPGFVEADDLDGGVVVFQCDSRIEFAGSLIRESHYASG